MRVGRVAGQPGRREPRGRVPHPRERGGQGRGVRVQGVGEDAVGRSLLDEAAGVHHRDPVADVGEHRQVVADHQHARRRAPAPGWRAPPAPGPAPSRRAPWSARRPRSARGGRPAPSRSSPVAVGRPRAGGGRTAHGRARARPVRAARRPDAPPRRPRRRARGPRSVRRSAGRSCWTGLSECSAPWKTMEAPAHRTARRSPHRIVRTSSSSKRTVPVTSADSGCSRSAVLASVDLPQPDSPATPDHLAALDRQVDAADGRQVAAGGPVGDVEVLDPQQRAHHAASSSRPAGAG